MNHLHAWRQHFEHTLAACLQTHCQYAPLIEPMRYCLLGGGKRIRPLMVYATGHALNIPISALDAPACAIECIHCYSLIHDDLPAMDDDDIRRGKASCHKAFDEATAILTGDALLTLAFQCLSTPNPNLTPAQQIRMIQCLSAAAGATGMISGQQRDIQSQHTSSNHHTIASIHAEKTGQLFQAAFQMGCIPHTGFTIPHDLGITFGAAYQLQDDLLERTQSSVTLGKSNQSDTHNQTPTLIDILGLSEAQALLAAQYSTLRDCICASFKQPETLLQIIDLVADRNY